MGAAVQSTNITAMLSSSDFKDGSGAAAGQARGPRRSASKDHVVRRDVDSVTYERGGGGYANDEVSIGVDWPGDGVSQRQRVQVASLSLSMSD